MIWTSNGNSPYSIIPSQPKRSSLARHLVIFARWPQLGSGKRRLAAGVGAVEALRFQRVTLSLTVLRLGRDRRWITWLAVTPDGGL